MKLEITDKMGKLVIVECDRYYFSGDDLILYRQARVERQSRFDGEFGLRYEAEKLTPFGIYKSPMSFREVHNAEPDT